VATTAGRVERVLVQPGQTVEANDVLLVLSNPDVQVEGLDAERQLSAAESELTTLRSTLQTQILDQQSALATTRSQHREAQRQLESYRELSGRNLISAHELAAAEDRAEELATRMRIDEERLRILEASFDERLTAQRVQIERLRSISSFQFQRAQSMEVRAGAHGVVQDLDLEVGQWVMAGQSLARVAEPGRLMAELRIPETQARDVAIGQAARIDTRNGVVPGFVRRIDPNIQNGTITVEGGGAAARCPTGPDRRWRHPDRAPAERAARESTRRRCRSGDARGVGHRRR
jgi:HlyD family secretion protein